MGKKKSRSGGKSVVGKARRKKVRVVRTQIPASVYRKIVKEANRKNREYQDLDETESNLSVTPDDIRFI